MAEITMQELMEKEISDNEEIFMTDDTYGFGITIEHSHGQVWYFLYSRISIAGQFVAALIRVYHEKDSAIATFKALTV